jgi:hypothetical protein
MVDIDGIFCFQQSRNLIAERAVFPMRPQQRRDATAWIADDLRSPDFMPFTHAARLLNAFKGVAERTMTKIV